MRGTAGGGHEQGESWAVVIVPIQNHQHVHMCRHLTGHYATHPKHHTPHTAHRTPHTTHHTLHVHHLQCSQRHHIINNHPPHRVPTFYIQF